MAWQMSVCRYCHEQIHLATYSPPPRWVHTDTPGVWRDHPPFPREDPLVTQNAELHARIDNDFAFHPATTQEKRDEHSSVRVHCRDLAHFIVDNVPYGREQQLAITKCQEAMMWSNAGIAIVGPVG